MGRVLVPTAVLLCLLSPAKLCAQSSNASLGGFVQDATHAFMPGATINATNTQTGVSTTVLTNETGTYNFPSLLPGTYRLSAELVGFRPYIYNDAPLGAGVAARYNFVLEVGAVTSAVEVTTERSVAIAQSSASIGQVLTTENVRDLPLVTNNVLDLMKTMAGIRGDGLGTDTTFAGISTALVNTTRDGISVQENRYNLGVTSTTVINPDLVGEMRVILAPVDAETGRGNGQVQILTRSGTNRYSGSAVWAVRNSALDANTWVNNRDAIQPDWLSRHQATVSYGGPIIKNKTFFFVLYDQQIERRRDTQLLPVLTDCARNGIFRYWEGWANGNTETTVSPVGSNPTRPSVDSFGNPVRPATNASDGSPYTGQLRFFSVFGPVVNTPIRPDCSDAVVERTPWDPDRTGMDPVGLARKFLDVMPHANRFQNGDGLNTAQHQWLRGSRNSGSGNLALGSDTDADREQINIKLDHQFNPRHKAAVNYSYEWIDIYGQANWPGGYSQQLIRRPQVLTINVTSTLTPRLLNEARIGYRQNFHVLWAPWEVTDSEKRKVPLSMLLAGGGFPIAVQLATVGGVNTNNFSCFTNCGQQGNKTPLYQYGDTLSWTKGKHAFKGGGEVRFGYSTGSETPTAPIPKAFGGGGSNPITPFRNPSLPGLVTNNQTLANSLLYFLSGSLSSAQQYYFIQSPDHQNQWLNYNSTKDHRKITDTRQKELSMFFKDDWKVSPSLTLNLGMRYDYYGVPYEGQGLTAIPVGGGDALFGVSGRRFDKWMNPDAGVDMNLVTTLEFVGPKTSNPDKTAYKKDWNNFGPAIGFAWQPPWFGKGKTNVRGGYQITYAGGGRYANLANNIFANQGYVFQAISQGPVDGSYFDTSDLSGLIPIAPTTLPMAPIPVQKKNVNAWAFDNNYVAPYIQNFTLSVARDITRKLNLDVRYIGTRGVKLWSDLFNLNTPNVYYNPVLFDALERTRHGENVLLFDQMFLGLNLSGSAPVNGTTQRGSEYLRQSSTFSTSLANGDYAAVAGALNTFNGTVVGSAGERGTVLRRANRGFNVPGGTNVPGGIVVPAGLFPENWIVSNPQFNNAYLFSNSGSSNYHSLQVQGTLRPAYGLSFVGTYVWSKALEVPTQFSNPGLGTTGTGYTNPADRQKDYALAPQHVAHDFRAFGTFELPIGPNKLMFANSSRWVARLIEGWQTSFIFNISTGQPASITAGNMLYSNGVADVVGPFSLRKGNVHWGDAGSSGTLVGGYFESGAFRKVQDPQCSQVAKSLQPFCTLKAVTRADTGEIVLQNPQPGNRGTVGRQTIELPGHWTFDASMGKTFKIAESRSLQVRFDATNIFNHPLPVAPDLGINSENPFGYISAKGTQHREFRGLLRLSF